MNQPAIALVENDPSPNMHSAEAYGVFLLRTDQSPPLVYHHPSFGNRDHHFAQMGQDLGQVMEEGANTLTSKEDDFSDSAASLDS